MDKGAVGLVSAIKEFTSQNLDDLHLEELTVCFSGKEDSVIIKASRPEKEYYLKIIGVSKLMTDGQLKTSGEQEKTKPEKKRARKISRKTGGKYSLSRVFDVSKDEDIRIMRFYLSRWKKEGLLSENQKKALDTIGQTRNSSLTTGQKEQIFAMFNDVKKHLD